jgi:glycosyltransferase involved in cell wall biosynthesis
MRLAYLSTDPGVPWGGAKGASVHLGEMARALAAQGGELLLLVAGVEKDGPPPPSGVRLELLPRPGKGPTEAKRIAAEPMRTAWIARRLERFGAEALYERIALHSAAGSAAASALGIPHLVELNAPLPEEAARYRRLERGDAAVQLEGTVLQNADLVLAVSSPLADYARARGARRVKVCPNAVSLERFGTRAAHDVKEPLAVFAGGLRPWHGVDTLAEAWRLLGSGAPGLLVVGDGPGREPLDAVGAGVTGWVEHDRVPALLAGAHIGLAPYAADAPPYFSPLKLFAYLAAGLAVVAARLPGVTEVVDERSAVLVPPGDAGALADAVSELAADPARRAELGSAGHDLVRSRHTWRRRARDVMQAASGLAEFQVALARPVAGGPRVTAGGASRKRLRTFDPYLAKAPRAGET